MRTPTVFASVSNCLSSPLSGDARACGARRVRLRICVRVCVWCAQGPESQTVSFSSRQATAGLAKAASSITPLRRWQTCVFCLRLSLFAALCMLCVSRQSAHGVRPPSLLSLSASRKLVRAHTPGRCCPSLASWAHPWPSLASDYGSIRASSAGGST